MTQWISDRGATIGKLHRHAPLWVLERLPPQGQHQYAQWFAGAEPGEHIDRLLNKWAASAGVGPLPHTRESRARRFNELVAAASPLALMVTNADCLSRRTFDHLQQLSEQGALVLLIGDVMRIGAVTRNSPSFSLRAGYCVEVDHPFE